MTRSPVQRRQQAVARYLAGDKIEDICKQMGCSKSWLYKWKNRYQADDPSWHQERSRRPARQTTQKASNRCRQRPRFIGFCVALNSTTLSIDKGDTKRKSRYQNRARSSRVSP